MLVDLTKCGYWFVILNDVQGYLDCANICFAATDALFSYGSLNLLAAKKQMYLYLPAMLCNKDTTRFPSMLGV